jgi:hypothetical protein
MPSRPQWHAGASISRCTTRDAYSEVFEKYKSKILEVAQRTGDTPSVNAKLRSLAKLIRFICDHEDRVEEAAGPESHLRIPATHDVFFRVYLPLRKLRGVLMQRIAQGDFDLDHFPEMNDSSIALLLDIAGTRILLGGDSTLPQWQEHRRSMRRDGIERLDATVVKVPHHGSRHNAQAWLYEYFLAAPPAKCHVLVSANGLTHPHDEFFALVSAMGMAPYCTNLASQCMETYLLHIDGLVQLPDSVRPFLINYEAYRKPHACQGDVTIELANHGIRLFNSTGAPCVYSPGQMRAQRTIRP